MLQKVYGRRSGRRAPLRPARRVEHLEGGNDSRAGPEARFHFVDRAPESHDADVHAPVYLTNGFSKTLENHPAAVALHYIHYNFVRIHRTLRVTPAMESGLTNRVWSIEDVIGLLELAEGEPAA